MNFLGAGLVTTAWVGAATCSSSSGSPSCASDGRRPHVSTLDDSGRDVEPNGDRASAAISRASATPQRVRAFVSDLLEFARFGAKPPPGL
jgi:hypothetical protein